MYQYNCECFYERQNGLILNQEILFQFCSSVTLKKTSQVTILHIRPLNRRILGSLMNIYVGQFPFLASG
jgi:hypothetical protein